MPGWFQWLADAGVELVLLLGVLASILRGLADFYRNRPGRGRPPVRQGDRPPRTAPARPPLPPTLPHETPTRRPAPAGSPRSATVGRHPAEGAGPGADGGRVPDAAAPPAAPRERPPARPGRPPRPAPEPTAGPWGDLWGELMRQLEELLGDGMEGEADGRGRRPPTAPGGGPAAPMPRSRRQPFAPGEGAPGEEGTPGVEGQPGPDETAGPRGRQRPRPPHRAPAAGAASTPDGGPAAGSPAGETAAVPSPAVEDAFPGAAAAASRVLLPVAARTAPDQRRAALVAGWLWLEVLSPPRALRPWHPGPDLLRRR